MAAKPGPLVILWTVQSPHAGVIRTYHRFAKAKAYLALLVKQYGQSRDDGFYIRSITEGELTPTGWTHALDRAAVDEKRHR